MIKLNKIYTKTGDGGSTALGDGERVLKDSLRVSAYGNVDELNASIGIITLHANTELKRKLKNCFITLIFLNLVEVFILFTTKNSTHLFLGRIDAFFCICGFTVVLLFKRCFVIEYIINIL